MPIHVELTRPALKDLKDLLHEMHRRARAALERLTENPSAGHTLTGSLRGVRSLEFSGPGGAYRAAYVVNDNRCIVFMVGPHKGFYAKAERRAKTVLPVRD